MERLDLLGPLYSLPTQRTPLPPLGRRQYVAASVLWLIAVAATVALADNSILGKYLIDIAFFTFLYIVTVWMSASLPMSVHWARLATMMMIAAVALGIDDALVVGMVGGTVGTISLIPFRRLAGLEKIKLPSVFFAGLWNTASITLALLPGLAISQFRADFVDVLSSWAAYTNYLLFLLIYCATTLGSLTIWLLLRDQNPLRYFNARVRWELTLNGLMPMLFVPIVASIYRAWPNLRLLVAGAYSVALMLFYGTTRIYSALANRIAELRVINRIGQALNRNLDLDALIETIYQEMSSVINTSGMYLTLYDEANHRLSFPLYLVHGERKQIPSTAMANGVSEYIIRTRQPLLSNDSTPEEAARLGIQPRGESAKSYLGAPIMTGDTVIGVLAVCDYHSSYAYTESDVQLLETIANQAAVALANAQLYQRSQRQANELAALHTVSLMASATLELKEVLRTICEEAVRVMPFQKTAIFLMEEDGKTLNLVQSAGLSERYQKWSQNIDVTATSRTTVIQTGEPVVVPDIHEDARFAEFVQDAEEEGWSAFLDIPLHSGSRLIGSMTAYYAEPHVFDPTEIEMLQTLGGQITIAVENARLFEATRDRTRQLETLYDASTAINASLSLKNVLRAVAISMIQALEAKSCLALIAMEDRQELRAELRMLAEAEGILDDNFQEFTILLDDLPGAKQAIRRQVPMIIEATAEHLSAGEERLLRHTAAQSAVVVPVVARGNLVGLIVGGTSDGNHNYPASQLRLAEALANQAAVAIENAVLFERTDIALAHRLDEIQALELISQRMTRLDLQTVIEQVLYAARAATQAEYGEVALYDETADMLTVAARIEENNTHADTVWPGTRGVTGRAIQSGMPVLLDDVQRDPEYYEARPNIHSEMVIPFVLEGRRLGLINLESTRIGAFNVDHLRFVNSLAEHAGIAIQNARLFEAVQRRAEEFNTLRSIAVDLLSSTDVKHALRVIVRGAMERTHARDVHIYLYDQAQERLTFGASLWADGEIDKEINPPRPNGLTMAVAHSGERIVISNVREHPLFTEAATSLWPREPIHEMGALVGVPLKRGDEVIGVFNIAFDEPNALTEDILRYLDFLAAEASVAIANAKLQEETRTGRDLLQAILDSSHDGIIMLDMNERLVMVNSRMEWLLNVHLSEYIGMPMRAVLRQLVSSAGRGGPFLNREAHTVLRQIQQNPNQITRRRYTLIDPSLRAIEEVSLPVIGHNNELLGRMFILRDITQEYELETYRQEMSHMLIHDLRSPLGGVITGLHTAMDELQLGIDGEITPDLPMVNSMLSVALSSAGALLKLVESILDIHKLETGEVPLNLDEVDLGLLADRAKFTLEGTARDAAITIAIERPHDLPRLKADADKIERVFINLLDNALRYTPQGGSVWISVDCGDTYQTVTLRDTGEGVPSDMRDRIFERFVQADTTRRKRGSKGSGLGLTFCRLAVEAHGGRIWVDQGPEGGAAFHFTLPMGL